MAVTHQIRLNLLERMGDAELALPQEHWSFSAQGGSGAQSWQRGRLGRRVLCSAGLGWQPGHTRHGKKETFTRLKVVGSVSLAWEGNENCWIDTAEKEGRVALPLFRVSHSGGLISNFDLVYWFCVLMRQKGRGHKMLREI